MKDTFITCPHCGRQYHPAEIFYPETFFGKPKEIERNNNLQITSYFGKPMQLDEDYECDNCYKRFRVTAKLQFKVDPLAKYDMSRAYITDLFGDRLTLSEEFAENDSD